MARQAREVEIEGQFVAPGERSGQVRTGDDTAVPSQIHAEFHLREPAVVVQLYVLVEAGGRARVVETRVAARDIRKAVTNTALRAIPLDYLMRTALENATIKGIKNRPDLHKDAFQLPDGPEDGAWVSPRPAPIGRGREVPEERVAQAAQIYLDALAQGSPAPGDAVAKVMNYSRATAARDLRVARQRGLLPPAGQERRDATRPPSAEVVTGNPLPPGLGGSLVQPAPIVHPGVATPGTWQQEARDGAEINPREE